MEIDITNDDIESDSEEFQSVVQSMLDEGNDITNPVVVDNGRSKSVFDDSEEEKNDKDNDDNIDSNDDGNDDVEQDNDINYELEAHTYSDIGLAEPIHKEDETDTEPDEELVQKPAVVDGKRYNLRSA
jgi:hypothetical protein